MTAFTDRVAGTVKQILAEITGSIELKHEGEAQAHDNAPDEAVAENVRPSQSRTNGPQDGSKETPVSSSEATQ